jgi:hypothetical protein
VTTRTVSASRVDDFSVTYLASRTVVLEAAMDVMVLCRMRDVVSEELGAEAAEKVKRLKKRWCVLGPT